ncbi:hypothetical protein [Paraglaciecola chathamensis]|jgi:hypothetical protein|uniref:Uncharacterized protein n=1 Tax=Paraglaciecola chathamensis TaxID=368405 RepID=A0A8H9IHI7_9ALTE|nr:hypothetical protein [Paraglaciecola oceanifecundans]GGZ79231.1 hypothetical protein GCM10011274_41640 [Paraglaciecola oceanifecundans]
MILLLAIALGLIGSYLLYISWKQNNKFAALAGWVSLFVTVPLLVMDLGPEFGTVFALGLPALYVWLGILREQKTQPPKHIERQYKKTQFNGKKLLKNSGYIVYHLILLMLVSSLLVIAALDLLPLERPNQLAAGVIIIPLVWSGLSFWHLASSKTRTPLLFSAFVSLASSIYLFV